MNCPKNPKRILISAGELSGDEHAAGLIAALKGYQVPFEVRGMGGANMHREGAELTVNIEHSGSIMGFGTVLKSLPKILTALGDLKRLIISWKPDLVVLVDYPDFNLRLARFAHEHAIPVLYFIPPTVWAWRKGRLELIKKYVNKAALIYPFEEKFYRDNGYDNAHFVGHPFCESITRTPPSVDERAHFLRTRGLNPDKPVVADVPGSRWGEIERHLGTVLSAIAIFNERHPDVQFAIEIASSINREKLSALIPDKFPGKRCGGDPVMLLRCSDAGLLKSGTSNLQAAFAGLPFCMFFLASAFSTFIVKHFISIKEYSIVNLIKPGTVLELILEKAEPENMARELEVVLFDQERRSDLRRSLAEVVSAFQQDSSSGASLTAYQKTAKLVQELLLTVTETSN